MHNINTVLAVTATIEALWLQNQSEFSSWADITHGRCEVGYVSRLSWIYGSPLLICRYTNSRGTSKRFAPFAGAKRGWDLTPFTHNSHTGERRTQTAVRQVCCPSTPHLTGYTRGPPPTPRRRHTKHSGEYRRAPVCLHFFSLLAGLWEALRVLMSVIYAANVLRGLLSVSFYL